MKNKQKATSITLSAISLVLILLCTLLPIFSFWNYRLCMIPFALISTILFFTNLKERTQKVHIIIACVILILSATTIILGSNMEGVVISAVLSIYIAILLLLPKKNHTTLAITIISAIIATFLQISTICKWFNNYDLIYSGNFPEISLEAADSMLVTGFNEIGMAIIICCLIYSALSIQFSPTNDYKNRQANANENDINNSENSSITENEVIGLREELKPVPSVALEDASKSKIQNKPKRETKNSLEIINIFVIVLIQILSALGYDIASSCYGDNYEAIFLIGIIPVILKLISVIRRKDNIIMSIVVMISFLLMMYNSIGFVDGTNVFIALCLLYLIVCELYKIIQFIAKKYYTTQSYKIKCYKKIEQINTYREKGIITEEEYEKAREQIMSKIQY